MKRFRLISLFSIITLACVFIASLESCRRAQKQVDQLDSLVVVVLSKVEPEIEDRTWPVGEDGAHIGSFTMLREYTDLGPAPFTGFSTRRDLAVKNSIDLTISSRVNYYWVFTDDAFVEIRNNGGAETEWLIGRISDLLKEHGVEPVLSK